MPDLLDAVTVDNLRDALGQIWASASSHEDQETVMKRLCMTKQLQEHKGISYNEIRVNKMEAQRVQTGQRANNVQRITAEPTSAVPAKIYVLFGFEDDVKIRLQVDEVTHFGRQARMSMNRLIDQDGLLMIDSLTTTIGAAGSVLGPGEISAAGTRISVSDDKGQGSRMYGVFHPYATFALKKNLMVAGSTFGVRPMTTGLSVDVLRRGEIGDIDNVMMHQDSFISVDTNADANGVVFGSNSIWYVQGRPMWSKTFRDELLGGGAEFMVMYDEYTFHVPYPTRGWAIRVLADATTPTG